MSTPESLHGMVIELVCRGLPADYAHRAALELADHHRDLIDELQNAGWSESAAENEASRRLGNSRTLVKKTVREYQRRYWCARWPLITFLIGPIPVLIAAWFALMYSLWLAVYVLHKCRLLGDSDPNTMFLALPVGVKYAVLVTTFLIVPATVMCLFAHFAKRAALGWQWLVLVACLLGVFVGSYKWERIGPGSKLVMRDRQTLEPLEHPPQPDFVLMMWWPIDKQSCSWPELRRFFFSTPVQSCQILLPFAVAALLLYRRQLAWYAEMPAAPRC